MMSNNIILLLHIIFFYAIATSPFNNDYTFKKIILILLLFFCAQWMSEYGKCGLINIEKYFLKDKFKTGVVYRLVKPVICYKMNIFYKNYFEIILIYIFILYVQLIEGGYDLNLFSDVKKAYEMIVSLRKK